MIRKLSCGPNLAQQKRQSRLCSKTPMTNMKSTELEANHMIVCKDLSFQYGETVALNQLNLTIAQGEKVAIVGESGCGKTTLLHTMAGLLEGAKGHVTVHGEGIHAMRYGTAIILQNDGLFPWKNVKDNVMVALLQDRQSPGHKNQLISDVLKELGIEEHREKYLHELSGGQRQRVAIARALVQKPDLLLMDEPTGALDMVTKERFQDTLHQLYDHHAMTSVIVTHDIEEAVYLGQRVLIMDRGRIKTVVDNPYYGQEHLREDIRFYELCLKVRQVMKS